MQLFFALIDLAALASLAMKRAPRASLSLSPSAWDLRHALPLLGFFMEVLGTLLLVWASTAPLDSLPSSD